MREEMIKDIDLGLSLFPKRIDSKYFYDAQGDALFQQIMQLPEYYLTRAEEEILATQSSAIIDALGQSGPLDIYELGAGDGRKTTILLKALYARGMVRRYRPIDISLNVLKVLEKRILQEVQGVEVALIQSTYQGAFELMEKDQKVPRLFMFLGSNLGNLTHTEAIAFLGKIRSLMGPDDQLLLGLDKVKDPEKILLAYNDPQGVTRAFNLNLLRRINRELGANFDLSKFVHLPSYDPSTAVASSTLVSTCEQVVSIAATAKQYHFEAWEAIHTEISQKYSLSIIEWLAASAGLRLNEVYTDSQGLFYDCLLKR